MSKEALATWIEEQKKLGNTAAVEIGRVIREQYGDFVLIEGDAPTAVEKITVLSEAEKRANELRRKYQELSLDQKDIPLSRFSKKPVKDLQGIKIAKVFDFVATFGRYSQPILLEGSFEWTKQHRELAEKIAQWLVVCEKKTLERVGLTEEEKTPLEELGVSMRVFNSCRRYTGAYRHSQSPPTYWDLGRDLFWNIEVNLPSIEEVGTLAMRTEEELLSFRHLGAKSIAEIREKLGKSGLTLATAETD